MVTASHNPKAYTGVKLVREGALALSGDAGIGEIRDLVIGGLPEPPGGGDGRGRRRLRRLPAPRARLDRRRRRQAAARSSSTAATGWRGRWSGRCSSGSASTSSRPTGCRTASSPTTSRTRCCPRTASSSSTGCSTRAPTSGSPGTATPTAASSSTTRGEFVDGDFLTALLARLVLAKQPGAAILYDVRASRAVPDTVAALGGTAHVNRVGHAFFKQAMREHGAAFGGEVSGHYYFREFWCADSGTLPALLVLELLGVEGRPLSELVGEFREPLLHLRRDQLRGRRPGGEDEGDRRSATRTRRSAGSTASRSTTPTGTSTSARRTPSRCCGSTSSRWSRARTWRPKRDEVLALIRS